mgnify:CR=1 FL=1
MDNFIKITNSKSNNTDNLNNSNSEKYFKDISSFDNNIILTWTNKKCNNYNQYVRQKLFNKKKQSHKKKKNNKKSKKNNTFRRNKRTNLANKTLKNFKTGGNQDEIVPKIVEDNSDIVSTPTEIVEETLPTEVVETPTEVVEETLPTEVVETPTEVVETPTEVVETPPSRAAPEAEPLEEPEIDYDNHPLMQEHEANTPAKIGRAHV